MTNQNDKTGEAAPADTLDADLVASLSEMLAPAELAGLVQRAKDQLTALTNRLREAWTRNDLPAAQQEAHKLAGLAATVGCLQVYAVARDIETCCQRGLPESIEALFADLEQRLPPARAALAGWVRTLSG
jgi:HPt (histidine-containing phosphotransfer) domain-containing protein